MVDIKKNNWFKKAGHMAKQYSGKALLVLIGFVTGALIFTLCSFDGSAKDHGDHGLDEDQETTWTCSMHPQIRQPEFGQCPICGMDLIPVSSDNDQDKSGRNDRIVLSERARALVRLRTTQVRPLTDATAQLRLLGRIEPDETTLKTVTAWIGGRIDRLHVNSTGERIRAGQVIATLYSPEIFSAHQDLLVAKKQVEKMEGGHEASRRAALAALNAARERLSLLGVLDGELKKMEGQKRPARSVSIRSSFFGTVMERHATEGSYIKTGTPLYRVADLTTLWIQLDAYESDLSRLMVGQEVKISVEALPDEEFTGEVIFIEPTLDVRLRTAQVRVKVDNSDNTLRPGMFVTAIVETYDSEKKKTPLVVPATAPLFTGRRAIVYVEISTDESIAYESVTVRLGPRMGDFYPVVAGLSEGDVVVTRGAFALDADLQIRGGASMMTVDDDREKGMWDSIIELSVEQRQKLTPIVSSYLVLQQALAGDDFIGAKKGATKLAEEVLKIEFESSQEAHVAWSKISHELQGHSKHVSMSNDIEGARSGFEPLSLAIIESLSIFGNPMEHSLSLAFCPMAFGSKGALWVQKGNEIANSYFGESMLTCGEIRQELEPGVFLKPPSSSSASNEPQGANVGGHQH
jgi:membrane fusion protein, copper/silver efflux system